VSVVSDPNNGTRPFRCPDLKLTPPGSAATWSSLPPLGVSSRVFSSSHSIRLFPGSCRSSFVASLPMVPFTTSARAPESLAPHSLEVCQVVFCPRFSMRVGPSNAHYYPSSRSQLRPLNASPSSAKRRSPPQHPRGAPVFKRPLFFFQLKDDRFEETFSYPGFFARLTRSSCSKRSFSRFFPRRRTSMEAPPEPFVIKGVNILSICPPNSSGRTGTLSVSLDNRRPQPQETQKPDQKSRKKSPTTTSRSSDVPVTNNTPLHPHPQPIQSPQSCVPTSLVSFCGNT